MERLFLVEQIVVVMLDNLEVEERHRSIDHRAQQPTEVLELEMSMEELSIVWTR